MSGPPKSATRQSRGRTARQDGHAAEWLAAGLLMAKGYRILGFRLKTPQAEIDILALRGRFLAAVEVKRRQTLEAALECVTHDQRTRLLRAVQHIAARRPGLKEISIRLDLIAIAPGRLPRHIVDAWRGAGGRADGE